MRAALLPTQLQARLRRAGFSAQPSLVVDVNLSQAIRDALSSNDGRAIHVELNLAFSSIVAALNGSWNGQPLFAGERIGAGPIKITSLDALQAATQPEDLFSEAERHQTLDLGVGQPIQLANKASEISQPLFDQLRTLADMVDLAGGELPAPMSGEQRDALQVIAGLLEAEVDTFNNAEGRAGQLESRFAAERSRMTTRSNLLERRSAISRTRTSRRFP